MQASSIATVINGPAATLITLRARLEGLAVREIVVVRSN